MTYKVDDRVRETSTTAGTGNLTLAGAPAGYQDFASLGADNHCPYFLSDDTNWETGIGQVLTGPNRLVRTHVLASSNADALVSFPGGVSVIKVRCGLPAFLAFPTYLSKSIAGGAATFVLTQLEQRRQQLEFTGAITGNIVVEVDNTVWDWDVFNNTTGGFTVTMRVTGQTGVVMRQGKRAKVHCDGTDVRARNDLIGTFRHTVWVPAAAMFPRVTGGATAASRELATNRIQLRTLNYPNTGAFHAQFMLGAPKGWDEGTVTFKPVWTCAAGSGNVVWQCGVIATSDDDALDAAVGTKQTSIDTALAANDNMTGPESSAITIGGTPQEGDLLTFEITRDSAHASDTFTDTAELLGVWVYMNFNAMEDS